MNKQWPNKKEKVNDVMISGESIRERERESRSRK